MFGISRNTIYVWKKLQNHIGRLKHQVKGSIPRKVNRERLKSFIKEHPDVYLDEIVLEFDCHQVLFTMHLKP